MISRSKQILKLALSLERPELYYPKYESTKGLTDSEKSILLANCSSLLPAFDANELISSNQPGCNSELSKRKKNKNNEDTFEFEDNGSNVLPAFDANELISSNQPGCDSELSKRKKNKNNEDTFEFEDNDSNLLPAFSANELISFNKPGCDNELSKRKEKKKNKNNQNTFKFEDNAVNSFPVLEEPMSFDGYDSDKDPEFQPNDDDLEESESEFDCEFSPKFEENNNRNIEKKFRTIVNDSEENEICTTFNAVKRNRSQHFCFYCEEHVKQFSRHIVRNHKYEFEVQKILFLPKQSKERKQLITNLRNKGDFLCRQNRDDLKFRKNMIHDPLPYEHCLGFYSRKRLWIHKKYCSLRPSNDISKFSAGSAQTLLVSNLKMDRELIERVFPRMRADKISLTAKKDALICAFGSRFLKIHRDKHQVLVTSRKMRELAKVLIEMKKLNPQVNSLIEALRPINFDLLVKAVKAASKFNSEEDKYGAPTFAMNISTSLKDCCEVAICEILKKKHCFENKNFSETETEIKTMIMLIKSNWKYEISHHAANNLHSKKMNSIGIVPLASDLKKFKDYLKTTANSAAAKLQSDFNDRDAYKTLQQTVYCRIMLLCRKRPGELARLTVDLYNEGKEAQTYEEFENKIRPSERILMRKFKRVVIKGKRKATPVLFSLDVQEHIQILLDLRSNFTSQNDPYIFSKLISREPFRGYQVLMHHAKMAGLKNPDAIKSRGLRKHLATISQLFSMENEDVEQLATFMGHTLDVHRKEYRLPDDIFQTAKIAKLLLLMESGDAGKYQGKTLDEINLEEDLMNPEKNNETSEEDVSDEEGELLQQIKCTPQISNKVEQKKEVATVKKRVLTKWSDRQKQVALNFFKEHIKQKKPPKRDECAKLKELNGDLFNNKDWLKIKVFIQNIYTNKLKK